MVKAVVLYGSPEDPDAFERDYAGLGSEEGHAAVNDIPELRHRRRHDLLRRDRLTPRAVLAEVDPTSGPYGAALAYDAEQGADRSVLSLRLCVLCRR